MLVEVGNLRNRGASSPGAKQKEIVAAGPRARKLCDDGASPKG